VKDLGSFDDIARDLRESPGLMDLNLASVADGTYQVNVEVFEGSQSLGSASLRMMVLKGLDASVNRIEAEAKSAPETVRADALYPIDHMRIVNHGQMDLGQFDLAKELAASEQTLAEAKGGRDPFAGKTGDFKRHYMLKAANEIMPFRIYVPPAYNSSRAWPLVVALHGLGGTEDSMFGQSYRVSEQAARKGWIAVAPLGYRIDGGYGRGNTTRAKLSEQDVVEVLALVRRNYNIDARPYLPRRPFHGRGRNVGTGCKVRRCLGRDRADLGTCEPSGRREDSASADHGRPRRCRHGSAGGLQPLDGRCAQKAERGSEVRGSSGRKPRKRFRAEHGGDFRLLRRACETGGYGIEVTAARRVFAHRLFR
jgi:hypothetical protein